MAGALRFLAAARSDARLRARLTALEPDGGLGDVVAVASDSGFALDPRELRAAFIHDWGLRRARYLRSEP